jgi:hypothetical protein
MMIDGPYICSPDRFRRNKVAQKAVETLAMVKSVPSDFKKAHHLLKTWFSQKGLAARSFQDLINLTSYSAGHKLSSKDKKERTLAVKELESILGESVSFRVLERIRIIVSGLFYRFACDGLVNIPIYPFPELPKSEEFIESYGNIWFSPVVLSFMVAGTESSINKYKSLMQPDIAAALIAWLSSNADRYKSYNGAITLIRAYFAFYGTHKIDGMELKNFDMGVKATSTQSRSLGPFLEMSESNFTRFRQVVEDYRSAPDYFSIRAVSSVYHDHIYALRAERGLQDRTKLGPLPQSVRNLMPTKGKFKSSGSRSKLISCPVKTEHPQFGQLSRMVKSPFENAGYSIAYVAKDSLVFIDGYTFDTKHLSRYNLENLSDANQNSFWGLAQKDFLDGSQLEKSSRKNTISVLRIFNAYIFSYLPWFKAAFKSNIKIPLNITEFNVHLFVKRSYLKLEEFSEDEPLPATFPEFLEAVKDKTTLTKDNEKIKNSVRNSYTKIKSFFDEVILFEGGNEMTVNPLTGWSPSSGTRIPESTKKKIEYEYWYVFREFMFCIAEGLTTFLEDLNSLEELDGENCRTKISSLLVEQKISFGKQELSLEGVDLCDIDELSILSCYFSAGLITLLSFCGIRFQNGFWLDSSSFDAEVDYENKSENDYVPLFVNTDKARLTAFDSHLPVRVMKLLVRINSLREKLLGSAANESVFYQGNEESKWGAITPLFRFNDGFSENALYLTASSYLNEFVKIYEQMLRNNSVKFASHIIYRPLGMTSEAHATLRRLGRPVEATHYLYQDDKLGSFDPELIIPVVGINRVASFTLHSFRKTLVSFYSNYLDHKTIGDLLTGQTPETVGYYAACTPDEFEKGVSLALSEGMLSSVAQVSTFSRDEGVVKQELTSKGVTPEYFSVSPPEGESFSVNNAFLSSKKEDIAINRTHICPFNNECPSEILSMLGNKKLCAICPAALSMSQDGPAIASTIKMLGEKICSLSESIERDDNISGERANLVLKRNELIEEFATWTMRHNALLELTGGEVLVGEHGVKQLEKVAHYVQPGAVGEEAYNLIRIIESEGVKSLQTERLRSVSRRMIRKVASQIDIDLIDQIENNPVETAALLVKKTAALNGITLEQAYKYLQSNEVSNQRLGVINKLAIEISHE